jgi:hypothetical protein
MATLNIIDTGWYNLDRTGTQATSRANSGAAIVLPSASVQFKSDASVESTPLPGMIATSAQPIAYSNVVVSVVVLLRKDNSDDRGIFRDLFGVYGDSSYPGVHRTPGIKLLYMTTSTDVRKTIIELYGSSSGLMFHGNEISTNQPALPGYAYGFNVTDLPSSNMIRVGFDFQVA